MFTLSGTRQSPIVIARVFLTKKHFLDLPTFQLILNVNKVYGFFFCERCKLSGFTYHGY